MLPPPPLIHYCAPLRLYTSGPFISILGVDIFIEREHFGRALKVYETQSVPLPLTLESFYLTFILYTLGLVVATTVFL